MILSNRKAYAKSWVLKVIFYYYLVWQIFQLLKKPFFAPDHKRSKNVLLTDFKRSVKNNLKGNKWSMGQ